MPRFKSVLSKRISIAIRQADVWLDSVDVEALDTSAKAMHALAVSICRQRVCLHKLVEGTRRRQVFMPNADVLVNLSRPALLRLMLQVVRARRIEYPDEWTSQEYAGLLGGLALSYARDGDLTAVAIIVRASARFRTREALLDEACLFLLDHQSESGGFGLLAAEAAENGYDQAAIGAQLKATVDVISALDSYVERAL